MAKSGRPKTNSAAVTTDSEVKAPEPVVEVVPEVEETKKFHFGEKTFTVVNKAMAGRSITGSSGIIITFDENGKAKAGIKDAEHLSRVPGYSVS